MSRSICRIAATLLVTSSVAVSTASAQMPRAMPTHHFLRIGFGGGMTVPIGEVEESWESGFNGQAFLLISPPMLPPIRLNLGYQKFDLRQAVSGAMTEAMNTLTTGAMSAETTAAVQGESSVLSGVAGITLPLIGVGPISTYAMAGLGAFRIDESLASGADPEAAVHFGIDGGGGIKLRLGRLEGFVETRVQNVYTSDAGMIDKRTIRYLPLTFGLLF